MTQTNSSYNTLSCKATSGETSRYCPFVYAFNHALRALRDIDVPLRQSSDLDILFHRNDPKLISAQHHGDISQRKPDINLVSLDSARRAFAEGDLGSWADHALKTAADPPRNVFQWGDALSVAEFKRQKLSLPFPPPEYTINPAESILPQHLPSSTYEIVEDVFAQEEPLVHSDKATTIPSGKPVLLTENVIH
jgi:hypothetical protein